MRLFRILSAVFLVISQAGAQSAPPHSTPAAQQKLPTVHERVEVTTSRLPEEPEEVAAPIEVFMGDELDAKGARDLRTAMSSAIGVEIAPGGDTGPASSVPDFWGLKEFDAFLLVVDGAPWGGTFNPALTTLDLNDLERIEVLRGPAPVTYGATSFVGVINVVHKDIQSSERSLSVHGGSFGSGGGSFSTPIPMFGEWASRLSIDGEREGFRDDRTDYRRGHALWRVGRKPAGESRIWFNGDVNWLDQNPASPRPREDAPPNPDPGLSPLVPVDANQNPAGAFLDDHRFTGMAGFDRKVGGALWSTSGSVSQSRQNLYRGFLTVFDDVPDNAHGIKERIHLTDVYVDSHFSWKLPRSMTFLAGGDYLHGTGNAAGADFDYSAPLDGSSVPTAERPDVLDVTIHDHRNFFGPYASLGWRPWERVRVNAGVRLNITHESRQDADPGAGTASDVDRTDTRASASIGAIVTAWEHNQDSVGLYVNYRDTFKPAAIDFGIGEEEGGGEPSILKPETSRSVEGGVKGRFWDRRVDYEASGFFVNFANLVTATSVGGVPALMNTGTQQFKGFETGASLFLPRDFTARVNYSFHDATFTNFSQDFGSGPVDLAGKRLEMSAHQLAAVSLFYIPIHGFLGGVSMNYTGSRYLDRLNVALAEGFPTVDLSAGYRTARWEARVDARNLGDRRDPVAPSEMGESEYYLMSSRRVEGSFRVRF